MKITSPNKTVVVITAIENITSSLGTCERVVEVCENWDVAHKQKAELDSRKHFGVAYRLQEKTFVKESNDT